MLRRGDLGAFVRFLQTYIIPLLMPFIKILSTPKRAARLITKILIDASGQTGIYYDKRGQPMQGSTLVRDPTFQDRRRRRDARHAVNALGASGVAHYALDPIAAARLWQIFLEALS